MDQKLIARATITIDAPASEIWQALTDPALIQQYLFGTRVSTDWRAAPPG